MEYTHALHDKKLNLNDSGIARINEVLKEIDALINGLIMDNIEQEVDAVINIFSNPVTKNNRDHGWHEASQEEVLNLFKRLKSDIGKDVLIEDNPDYQNLLEKVRMLGVDTGELYKVLTIISGYISNLKKPKAGSS